MRSVEVLVIGAGASGMMAAVTAAESGAKVLLIEKLNRLGKKLLATGNGKCNFTNLRQKKSCYHSREPEFAWQALSFFREQEAISWFRERGIFPTDKDGYVYPLSGQASSVVNILQRMIQIAGVQVRTEEQVEQICVHRDRKGEKQAGYEVLTDKEKYLAGQVIFAVGGAAAPVHGTTGDGYVIARNLGLSVIPPVPALTSLILEGKFCKTWVGVRVQGQVDLYSMRGEQLGGDTGELQMVAYGISGIPVFQISHLAARELAEGRTPYLVLDCIPQMSDRELLAELLRRKEKWSRCSVGDVLDGILPQKLVSALVGEAGLKNNLLAGNIGKDQWADLVKQIKRKRLTVREASGFEKAQVTSGGVAVSQIRPETMEVIQYPGLYMTGELLDVDGICGGYNLQWAWTSGYLAGQSAGQRAVFNRRERIKRSRT